MLKFNKLFTFSKEHMKKQELFFSYPTFANLLPLRPKKKKRGRIKQSEKL